MKKTVVLFLAIIMTLTLAACGSKDNSAPKKAEVKNLSQKEIMGNYIEQNSGASLRIEDEYIYYTVNLGNFWSEPHEEVHNYTIEGKSITTPVTEEGWDSFDISSYGSGYCLSNDVYTFIPFDDFYSFKKADINKVSEKASCENFSLTLLDVDYSNHIDILEYVTEMWVSHNKDKFILDAPEDKCFVKMNIKIENEGKETCSAEEILSVSLVYDNSYVFKSYETEGNSLVLEPMSYCYTDGNSATNAGDLSISPLSSKQFTVNMICPAALKENTDKPLYAVFSLATKDGTPSILVYDLR